MKLVADTSVWIDHLNGRDSALRRFLEAELIWLHPMVVGELATGAIKNRQGILDRLFESRFVEPASDTDVITFIGVHRLYGKGLSFIDCHLLASCTLDNGQLWTRDKRLRQAAEALRVAANLA